MVPATGEAAGVMPLCPACGRPARARYPYPEGTIFGCGACKLQWADMSSAGAAGEMNVTGVHDRYMDPASIDALRYEPFVAFFHRLARHGRLGPLAILDIGAGNGAFIAEALRRGHDAEGVEPDAAVAARTGAVRDRIRIARAEDVEPVGRPFDVITFWDSFEHLERPFATLDALRPRLAPGGLVFLRVNNRHDVFNLATAVALRLAPGLGRRLLRICFNLPQHRWNFSAAAMRTMLARAGWRIVEYRFTDTPVVRLTGNPALRVVFEVAYLVNRAIGGGKIGEYLIAPDAG